MLNYTLKSVALLFISMFFISLNVQGQTKSTFGKGITYLAPDSSFKMKFSTRFQQLAIVEMTLNNDPTNRDVESNILLRRSRIKFSGFAYSTKFQYKVELGLTNRDHGSPIPQTKNSARIILDAVVKYELGKNTYLWFGQTKLPGNRERLISSQKLQLVDRSLLNSKFTLDRDIGLQLRHNFKIGDMVVREIFSIAQGEGRNITSGNDGGFDYTGKLEFLPFGKFTSKGDYFGSDLKRESTPKLSVAVAYDYHDNAARQRGNTGDFLSETRTLTTIFADMMFKYNGYSVMASYANKQADGSSVITDELGEILEYFYTGTGLNVQAGYLFDGDWELAARYTSINPDEINPTDDITMYTLGFSKYISGHNLKLQSDISLTQKGLGDPVLMHRLQFEISF